MEFELGLKLTHTRDDDLTSMADLRITKDSSGPLFVSKETDSKFILTGHLRGFRKESIDIEINEAGNRIAISGKKPVQEMVLRGWIMQKKEVEIRAFRKVFEIPDGVILDKIKAKFNEETSNLTIIMPKSVKGYCGVVIEEVKEEEVGRGRPETTQNVVDKIAEEPEMKPVAAGEDPEKGTDKEAPKEKIDQGRFETREAVGEEIPEKEKPEEAEEKVEGGESRALENKEAEEETERVEETIEKENEGHKIKSKEENDQIGEESSSKPEVSKKKDPLQAEETLREKIPEEKAPDTGLEKHVPGPEMAKLVESGEHQSSLSIQVQEKQTTCKDHQMESKKPEDLQKQEPSTEVEELQKQEPSTEDKELTKPEEPCRVSELEETQKNEIAQFQEKSDHQDATQMKKPVSKKNKVCTPLVVAGSTLLVSLIVFVFQLIRAKKR